jgi:hypothetical protein
MKAITAILFAGLSATTLFAQLPAGTKPPGEDWVQLFNGKDLTGWHNVGVEKWTAEEGGILRGKNTTKFYGYLETIKTYRDFEFSVRFKCIGMGNSGIYFHTKFFPGTVDVSQGGQFEIDCNITHHTAGVYDSKKGWLVWPSPDKETTVRQGEWNDYVVSVKGNRYTSRLNGVEMVDYTDPNADFLDGTIALQLHAGGGGEMVFKDIWVRDLTRR